MFFNIHKNFVAGNTILGFVGIYSVITQVYNPLNKQRIISRYVGGKIFNIPHERAMIKMDCAINMFANLN